MYSCLCISPHNELNNTNLVYWGQQTLSQTELCTAIYNSCVVIQYLKLTAAAIEKSSTLTQLPREASATELNSMLTKP